MFKNFDPDCLKDYVRHGTLPDGAGVKLAFDPEVEAAIFKTTPHHINCIRPNACVSGPVVVGEFSNLPFRRMLVRFAKKHDFPLTSFPGGGHLFPLEFPERTARVIRDTIQNACPL